MSFPNDDNELDKVLTEAFARPPEADFDAWQRRHSQAVTYLNPKLISAQIRRRASIRRALIFATTAVVVVCAWLGALHFGVDRTDGAAFAQVLEQIQKAKNITWKQTEYRYDRVNGKHTWRETKAEFAYKAPDVYREVEIGKNAQIESIRITDEHRDFFLYPKKKRADLEETAMHYRSYGLHGPFHYDLDEMKKLQWVGTRRTATGDANIFRWSSGSGEDYWSFDLWIDPKTKRIVRQQVPGADIYDPDNDPQRNNPVGEHWTNGTPCCSVDYDIVYDTDLDDSLFSFEAPPGYKLSVQHRNYVTEQEMIDYTGIVAEANDKVFPALLPGQLAFNFPSRERERATREKPEKDRTPAEQKYDDVISHYVRLNLLCMPLYHFITDNAVKDSFQYLGKGVKLGDRSAVVCWYKLKDAKDGNTYRVVYGDLSVKDVAAQDLPLPVEP